MDMLGTATSHSVLLTLGDLHTGLDYTSHADSGGTDRVSNFDPLTRFSVHGRSFVAKMSNGDETEQPDMLLMAEVANYSGFPSNLDDTDWNWTQTEPSVIVAARSTGFQMAIVVVLSFLIVAGTLLNLVTVVTHLQAANRSLQRRATGYIGFSGVRCRPFQS